MTQKSPAQLDLDIELALSKPVAATKTPAELDADIAKVIGLTRHGEITPATRHLAGLAEDRGDVAEIDRLEREIAKEITGTASAGQRFWLRGSTNWLKRAGETTTAKTARAIAAAAPTSADPDRVSAYEAKQERKRERLEAGAKKAAAKASSAFDTAHRIGSGIPMGQPILVGHHSEKRHRRDIAKIDSAMRKGIEADKYAKELASRAASVGTAGISSDDPEAVKKLKRELNQLNVNQERMKLANATIRKHAKAGPEAQVSALMTLGYSEPQAKEVLAPDFAGRIGIPSYALTNNGANIRRIEKRIAELVAKETTPARESIRGEIEGLTFTISENKDANRTQISFSGKPSEALRSKLKSGGFRWAPSEDAWQRQLSNGAWYHATRALGVG